uniref:MHC class I-like antigen recognition-like domain-containing protein n=1 Tax=Cyprinus carpio TaxID=7962 RepID=A0A8C1X4Q0_CYPCA
MGLLDDRQIHSYNSEEQKKIPTQHWMKEKMPVDYWEEGTQSRKITEKTFNENINIPMKPMRRNESDEKHSHSLTSDNMRSSEMSIGKSALSVKMILGL